MTLNETADLLARVETFLRRFVRFDNDAQPIAVTLWVAHTYAINAADCTPYLSISSAEKRSGKTRLMEVLELLARQAVFTSNISAAALFRSIGGVKPSVLFDEVDTVFRQTKGGDDTNETLRGVLNAGYRKGATVIRVVGQGRNAKPEKFPVFCPKALAAKGTNVLPDTVADRSIPIVLKRKLKTEPVERFRLRFVKKDAEQLTDWLYAWADGDRIAQLEAARPALPDILSDRAQDIWEPLLAIADHAGNGWPERARTAAIQLHSEQISEDSYTVLLLRHMRDIFDDTQLERLATDTALLRLVERDDGPWASWWERDVRQAMLNQTVARGPAAKLARILKAYDIEPKKFKTGMGNVTARGYIRADFLDAWARYLDADGPAQDASAKSEPGNTAGQSPTNTEPGEEPVPSSQAADQGSSEVPTFDAEPEGWERRPGDRWPPADSGIRVDF